MSRLGAEIIAGPVAIQQALFFEYGWPIRRIARRFGLAYSTVYHNVWRNRSIVPWAMRKHKREAIDSARPIAEEWHAE